VKLCLQDSEIQEKKKLWFRIRKQRLISDSGCGSYLKKGHKIQIQISTWFPLFAVNPQKFMDNPNFATKEDYTKAFIKVF
jgi:hypothetical protein